MNNAIKKDAGMANALYPSAPAATSVRRRTQPLHVVAPHLHRVAITVLILISLLLLQLVDASSIRRPGTSRKASSSRPDPNAPLHLPAHCRPNRFAALSPPTVAAVCRDGVVLVAVHSGPALEPLLVPAARADSEEQGEASSEQDTGDDSGTAAGAALEDLPGTYRGPFRVSPIDGHGTTLLSVGWRADCVALAAKCRSLAAEEAATYGLGMGLLGSTGGDGEDGDDAVLMGPDYAASIAADVSLWLAKCAISGGMRTMNCVGLLASCSTAGGCLHLIDETSIHRVRALAIGLGSKRINRRLVEVDFSSMEWGEAVNTLLGIIAQEAGVARNDGGKQEDEDKDSDGDDDAPTENEKETRWQLPEGSRVELAFVDAKRMRRINQRMVEGSIIDAS